MNNAIVARGAHILHPRWNERVECAADEPAQRAAGDRNRCGAGKLTVGQRSGGGCSRRFSSGCAHHNQRHCEQGDNRAKWRCRLDLGSADQQLPHRKGEKRPDHVDREDPPALRRLGFGIEPTLGGDEQSGATKPDDRSKDQPYERSDHQRHGRSRGGDETGEGGIATDVPDPLDDLSTAQRGEREAGEIAAEHETGHGRAEVLNRHPQGDKGAEEPISELDEAGRDDQRRDLRSHPPA
jgi:hypothetical protein